MANSAFSPTVLTLPSTGGTGQGELNLITNPVAATDTTGWVGAGRGTSGGPLNPSVGTYFTVLNTASAESSTSGAYDVITLPSGLQNRKLKVEFYYTSPAADTFKVSVYKGTTRVPLSTDSSGTTTLPASTTGKYVGYFDTDSSGTWTVSITRTAGTGATALQFTQVVVGPGIQPQGAVIGEWQSYTPTIDGFGTVTPLEARYRRVGSSIEVVAKWTNGTPAASQARVYVPTGLTVAAGSQTQVVGRWFRDASTGSVRKSSPILQLNSAQQYVIFTSDDYTTASGPYTGLNGSALAVAGENLGVNFTVPIAEWSGSGTVTLAQNDVEYAWNSDPGTSANTLYSNSTYYGYGPNGTPILAVNSTTPSSESKTRYTVQFQTPVQPGDQVVLELNDGTGWMPAVQRLPGATLNVASYGFTTLAVSSTTYQVAFGNAGFSAVGATTYGASGGAWSVLSSWRWRVRKSSAGAAVGFGIHQPGVSSGLVSASGLVGRTDGQVVPASYVGETSVTSPAAAVLVGTSGNYKTITSKVLTPGVYIVAGSTYLSPGTATGITMVLGSVSTLNNDLDTFNYVAAVNYSAGTKPITLALPLRFLNISTTTTIYLVGRLDYTTAGTAEFNTASTLSTVRIA